MTEQEERPGFTVDFIGGDAEFGPASYDAWSNYLDKLRKREEDAGNRELLMACCTSHGVNESTGEHKLVALLDESPAAVDDIAREIEEISGGEADPVVDKREVRLHNMTFRSPRAREWSTYNENLKDQDRFKGGEASKMLLADLCDNKDAFEAFIRVNPAALGSLMVPIAKLAGRGIKITRKKV